MRINLVCMGKTDDRDLSRQVQYYCDRLPRYWNFELTEIPDLKNAKNLSPELIKKEESKIFLNHIDNSDTVILLDEKGKQYSSRQFSTQINQWMNASVRRIVFIIGGAYGFSDEMYSRADGMISLSKMTFTHQMIRLFFAEQLYRADQILQGKPYHND